MLEIVLDYCRKHDLFTSGEKVLVAVSGGADSIATLCALHKLRDELGISLHVAHLNHGFRGEAAAQDAEFVARLCTELSLPFHLREVDIPGILATRGGSAQSVSRRERLRFFHDIALREDISVVALGHHADDQAETILLHLIRGSSYTGLAGMATSIVLEGLRMVRPLLGISRDRIMDYLEETGRAYRTDASNFKDDYTRNLLRNKVIPLMRDINPAVDLALIRMAQLVRDDEAVLCGLTDKLWQSVAEMTYAGVHIMTDMLRSYPISLQRRLVRRAWQESFGDTTDLEFVHVTNILSLCDKQRGRQVELPQGRVAVRERQSILFTLAHVASSYNYELEIPGELSLPNGLLLTAEDTYAKSNVAEDLSTIIALENPKLTVRSRLPGDKYMPAGFTGHRKLKDVMLEANVPRLQRGSWPVVVDGENIVWTPGARVAQTYAPTPTSTRLVKLSLRKGGMTHAQE